MDGPLISIGEQQADGGNFLNYHEEQKRSDVEDWQLDQEKVKIISST